MFHNKRIPVKNWNVRIGYDGTSTSVCNILLELYLGCKNYYNYDIARFTDAFDSSSKRLLLDEA